MFNRKWNDNSLMYVNPLDRNPRKTHQFLEDYRMRIDFPPVNVEKKERFFKVFMAAPGLEKKDFNVQVEDGQLIVSAEKKKVKEETTKSYVHQEYDFHSFRRSFVLPDNVDTDKINAFYINGILTIKIPYLKTEVKKGGTLVPVG